MTRGKCANLYSLTYLVPYLQVPVDLRGAGDDVVRMARAVFSDRVRLLWSDDDPASQPPSGGVGVGGRWASPGPARRPLRVPWRLRHFLAYSRRRPALATPGHAAVPLDCLLVHFNEVDYTHTHTHTHTTV